MNLRVAGAGLTLALTMPLLAGGPAFAQLSDAIGTEPEVTESGSAALPEAGPRSSFVPADFMVPTMVEAEGFKLVPLGPDLVEVDFDAYMSSIEHLQETFTRSTNWPRADITDADAMLDMEAEQARFQDRASFAYAVLTADGRRERGSLYVSPSTLKGYDAVVRLWVTKAEYDAGFDAELYAWATHWLQADWPFESVAFPGRAIDWPIWDAMVAENIAKESPSEE